MGITMTLTEFHKFGQALKLDLFDHQGNDHQIRYQCRLDLFPSYTKP